MYSLADDVQVVDVDFGAVLLNRATGRYWELNQMGAFILNLAISKVSIESIADNISRSYDVDRSQARRDALGVLASLREAGILGEDAE